MNAESVTDLVSDHNTVTVKVTNTIVLGLAVVMLNLMYVVSVTDQELVKINVTVMETF